MASRPSRRRNRTPESAPTPTERFRAADAYRAKREWARYEGTAQRDLFRELRERFLLRHAASSGWILDVGSGPGRFLPFAGRHDVRRAALDISKEMLAMIPDSWVISAEQGKVPERVRGDARNPPFERGRLTEVVVLGNTLGFSEESGDHLLEEAEGLVAPGGLLELEIAPAPGERSRYLARLPPASVARLVRAPTRAVLSRIDREGFRAETPRRASGTSFRRFVVSEVHERWLRMGWEVEETMAVAPLLGPDAVRAAAARSDAKSWARLLDLEEQVGRRPERWPEAASVLLSVRRPALKAHR